MRYVLAVLNSKLMDRYYGLVSLEKGRALAQIDIETLDLIPIRALNFTDSTDISHHKKVVALVDRMLQLHRRLAEARLPQEKTTLQRQIEATDKQIDRLV